jgi:acyl-CoA reductase-like NAD-dependent aldehyde dehydrogenase
VDHSRNRIYSAQSKFRDGLVHINDQTISDEAQVPFGGVKESGAVSF